MASFSGFIRKSPTNRLRQYFEARGVDAPGGFDWTNEGRGTALVRSIEELLEELTDKQQDRIKAELDLLASRIKAFRTYTVEEAADVCDVSARTIRNWVAEGLRVMAAEGPMLFRGDDLRDFIKAKRKRRKTKTALDTFYCVCCRTTRKAAGGFADCTIQGNRVMLTALCETCDTIVSKPIAKARIPEISRTLDLTIRQHETTL